MKRSLLLILVTLALLLLAAPALAADTAQADGSAAVYLDSEPRFSDHEQIDNQLAVSVLLELGVVDGYRQSDGSFLFLPDKAVTRAEMAKMICYINTGGQDVAAEQDIAAAEFRDVPANHWARPYVQYCAGLGIISGRGDGVFDPEGTVTPHEALKMLLVAMGYDSQQFLGEGWQQVVMDYYHQLGMRANDFNMNIPAFDTTVSAHGGSRDNIALGVYRALFAKTADSSDNWLIASFGAERAKQIEAKIAQLLTKPEQPDEDAPSLADLPKHTELVAFFDANSSYSTSGGYGCNAYDQEGKKLPPLIFEKQLPKSGVYIFKIMSDNTVHLYNKGDDYLFCDTPYTVSIVGNEANRNTYTATDGTTFSLRETTLIFLLEDDGLKEDSDLLQNDVFYPLRSDSGKLLAVYITSRP